ncbi:hypothetical protein E1I18_00880 [Mycoplasmopsis mucosicanis]|uniref:Uncharacterized protein n=1 Tax=Mycoplasmopsis mucosicanis TaxID=458208 RepID=A0A507SQA4_9BACT|nr:hypothetical protein [Mycoplasmopsis mucosicanis]TQC53999.1 hypothetical protein E1I18_00880 [Mycoplasmopsis mucosicanis]
MNRKHKLLIFSSLATTISAIVVASCSNNSKKQDTVSLHLKPDKKLFISENNLSMLEKTLFEFSNNTNNVYVDIEFTGITKLPNNDIELKYKLIKNTGEKTEEKGLIIKASQLLSSEPTVQDKNKKQQDSKQSIPGATEPNNQGKSSSEPKDKPPIIDEDEDGFIVPDDEDSSDEEGEVPLDPDDDPYEPGSDENDEEDIDSDDSSTPPNQGIKPSPGEKQKPPREKQKPSRPRNPNGHSKGKNKKPPKVNINEKLGKFSATPKTEDKIRLASWNVKNYGNDAPVSKGQAIASVIYVNNYDVVGLTELDGDNVPNILVDLLNDLEKKNNRNNTWKAIISDKYDALNGKGQADGYAAFIYKDNIVSPLVLGDKKSGRFYDNSEGFETKYGGSVNQFNRPPFLVQFGVKTPKYQKVNFTYMLSHLDGPGTGKDSPEPKANGVKKQGAYEANEAWNIKKVFDWAKKITNGDDDLIFQGDTNIHKGNQSKVFGWTKDYGAVMPLDEDNILTSLKANNNGYSEPYDKIIHYSNMNYTNATTFRLYDFVRYSNIFQYAPINSYEDWVKYVKGYNSKRYSQSYVYHGISDHSPISYDLILDKNDAH